MPSPLRASPEGLLAAGGDLEPGTILAAYRHGIFPWPDGSGRVLWWSPDPRALMPLDGFHQSRSLQRLRRRGRLIVTADRACPDVIRACGERAEGTWITDQMYDAYVRLHALGWVHSIEVWEDAQLVGGVYGVAIGGFYAAESMFHRVNNASKIALAALVERLTARGFTLLDVQFKTEHLATLGVIEIRRATYLHHLREATAISATF